MHPTIRRAAVVLAASLLACLALAGAGVSSASAASGQPVTLELHGTIVGPASVAGTWTAIGAIEDSGTYTETFHFSRDGSHISVGKVLVGSAGTIVLKANARVVYQSATRIGFVRGRWSVDFGTGAYAGLRAGGRPAVTADSFADLASGEVSITHVGLVRS
jgi:hypothetical protein